MKTFLKKTFTPIMSLNLLMIVAQLYPDQVRSFFAFFGTTAANLSVDVNRFLESWLPSLITIMVALAFVWLFRKEILTRYVKWRFPIEWNFDGFIGCSKFNDEAPYISSFQIIGINARGKAVPIKSAKIISAVTGKIRDVKFKTYDEYVIASELNDIPAGAKINGRSLFYDPAAREPGEREGMIKGEFLRSWERFDFIVEYENKTFKRHFSKTEIEEKISAVEPKIKAIPRLTKKDNVSVPLEK